MIYDVCYLKTSAKSSENVADIFLEIGKLAVLQ